MNGLPEGTVSLGPLTLHVETYRETPRVSYYKVTPTRGRRPAGEVRVGIDSVFSCLSCRKIDCIHADAARRFVASQPIDRTGTAGANDGDRF